MTKAAHTPGPWLSEGTTLYALNDDGVNRFQASFGPGHLTYTRRGSDERTSHEEVDANIALAKAAPDLLEALERMTYLQSGGPVKSSDADKWLKEARAAIAKAKGEA